MLNLTPHDITVRATMNGDIIYLATVPVARVSAY